MSIDADIKAAEPPTIVKMAASIQGVTGFLVGLTGLQLVGTRWVSDWYALLPYLICLLGAGSLFFAAMQYRARAWAGIGSVVWGALSTLAVLGFLGLLMVNGVMSCLAFVAVPLSFISLVLDVVALKGIRDTALARQRLSDEGLSLGL